MYVHVVDYRSGSGSRCAQHSTPPKPSTDALGHPTLTTEPSDAFLAGRVGEGVGLGCEQKWQQMADSHSEVTKGVPSGGARVERGKGNDQRTCRHAGDVRQSTATQHDSPCHGLRKTRRHAVAKLGDTLRHGQSVLCLSTGVGSGYQRPCRWRRARVKRQAHTARTLGGGGVGSMVEAVSAIF